MGNNNSARQVKVGDPPQTHQASDFATVSREQLIAEAAYYKAEQRGFQPGGELADWLEAQADVDQMLGNIISASEL